MSQSRTALIVDDEDQLLRLMARVAAQGGYRTWTARDGVEALRLFHEHRADIDLLLLDVFHPPGEGAAELLPELLAEKPGLDVILTSGDALSDELDRELRAIGGRFLRKPFAPKALLRLLDDASAARSASGGA
jgi:DNA-binding NtrC family response regulator